MEMEKKSHTIFMFFFFFRHTKKKLFSKYVMETSQNWAPPLKWTEKRVTTLVTICLWLTGLIFN